MYIRGDEIMTKNSRASGVLMHISSLPGEYSIGSFGSEALNFIDFLSECGFTYWQVLPFCIPDRHNSPYMSYSSFGGNPCFIDLEELAKEGLLDRETLESQKQKNPYICEFDRLNSERFSVLKKAAMNVSDRKPVIDFIESDIHLGNCCLFMAKKQQNNGRVWQEWDDGDVDDDILFTWQFIQYEFYSQWSKVKAYANKKGISIIGDMPIYVALDSSDVWEKRDLFLLDKTGRPEVVSGVPPDYFSSDGQLWGNPLYNWDKMKSDGYKWWKDRVAFSLKLFDGVRIDHFRAFSDYWSVPAGAETAKEGKWVKGPRKEIIDALNTVSEGKLIIAENLGIIDENVEKLLEYSGYPGMAVFQFGFDGNYNNMHLPHNYTYNTVAYTGTHDNNTLLGFMWELDDNTRNNVLDYIGYTDSNWDRSYDSIIKTMLMSQAKITIMPIQDILGFGSDTRLNTPGRANGNWSYRITNEQLGNVNRSKYFRLNKMYSRI